MIKNQEWYNSKIIIKRKGITIEKLTEELEKIIGEINVTWRFGSINPKNFVNPDIYIKKKDKNIIIELLTKHDFIHLD